MPDPICPFTYYLIKKTTFFRLLLQTLLFTLLLKILVFCVLLQNYDENCPCYIGSQSCCVIMYFSVKCACSCLYSLICTAISLLDFQHDNLFLEVFSFELENLCKTVIPDTAQKTLQKGLGAKCFRNMSSEEKFNAKRIRDT
jgi:hypothetical protein